MVSTHTMSASAARVKFMKLVRETTNGHLYFITHAAGHRAVILSEEEYLTLRANQRLLRNRKRLRAILSARKACAAGKGIPYERLRRETGLSDR